MQQQEAAVVVLLVLGLACEEGGATGLDEGDTSGLGVDGASPRGRTAMLTSY